LLAAGAAAWLLGTSSRLIDARQQSGAQVGVVRFSLSLPERVSLYAGGRVVPFALSPDGRWFAFTATSADGQSRLWLRPMDADVPQSIPGTEGARGPVWSSDSVWLGFDTQNIWHRVRVPGGIPENYQRLS
jgi:WD40 repeat protein